MKLIVRIVFPLMFVVLGVGVWCHYTSTEMKIRRTFAAIEKDVAKDGEEPMLTQAMRIKSISDRVSENCRFLIQEGPDVRVSRKEFSEIFAYYWRGMNRLHVAFPDLIIAASGDSAEVGGFVDFTGSDAVPGVGGPLKRSFMAWLKEGEDGEWRFTGVVLMAK